MTLDVPVALGLAVLFGRSVVDIVVRARRRVPRFVRRPRVLPADRPAVPAEGVRPDRVRSHVPLVPAALGAASSSERDASRSMPIERLQRRRPRRRAAGTKSCRPMPCCSTTAAQVDYAFITGEQTPVAACVRGDTVRAGGRVAGSARCGCACSPKSSHSQLASFWSNPVLRAAKDVLADRRSRRASGSGSPSRAIGLAAPGAVGVVAGRRAPA